jgi:hypothetical protein
MTMPKEVWQWEGRPLTRKQAELFQPRGASRKPSQVYDRDAVKEYLSGKIGREEMLRRIRR